MFYADLTMYEYGIGPYDIEKEKSSGVLNIGWLESEHPFPKGPTSWEFTDALLAICAQPVNRMRGYHTCSFCGRSKHHLFYLQKDVWLGDGEIRVPGDNGIIYAAPTLIYHYVMEHDYQPPEVFIQAVLKQSEAHVSTS